MGLLEGKVAIVTGAGGGLGRAHALAFAREGAKVVVNDPGVHRDGSGGGEPMADQVVAEIAALGGRAIASHHTVATREGADGIIRTALDAFGQLDILVNNAGILRDRTLLKMTDEEFDAVMRVHAYGTYYCTHAAAAVMKDAGRGGRIVNTSSYAGLIGNFGQANYGMAKAAIAGFTRVCALELGRAGITVNAIAPLAKTRMTEDIAAVPAEITPEQIAPFVVFLASDLASDVTGRVFGLHGPHIFEYKTLMTEGIRNADGHWNPADFASQLGAIGALPSAAAAPSEQSSEAQRIDALFKAIPKTYRAAKAGDWASTIHFEVTGTADYTLLVANGHAAVESGKVGTPKVTIRVDSAATLLDMTTGKVSPEAAFMSGKMKADNMGELMKFGQYFNLAKAAKLAAEPAGGEPSATPAVSAPAEGVNAAMVGHRIRGEAHFARPEHFREYARATNDPNPRYLEEGPDQIAPPMFVVRPVMKAVEKLVMDPALNADLLRLVHGEQDIRFLRPLSPWELVYPVAIFEKLDKKEAGELITCRQSLWSAGELVADIRSTYFVRAAQRPGGASKKPADAEAPPPPAYVFEVQETVDADQPIRYGRASGDMNPIHMDEGVARAAGHPSIILHGLATMAFVAKAVVNSLLDGDPTRLARLAGRFSRVVLPHDTLTIRGWEQEGNAGVRQIAVEAVNQKGVVVFAHGLAELR